jgi:hypothetical protein
VEEQQSPTTLDSKISTPPSGTAGSLNVEDLKLLFHFCSVTARTLSRAGETTDAAVKFWQESVPQIGFKYHCVLHLTLAIAAYHLAYLQIDDESQQRYISRGQKGFEFGLAEFTKQLPNLKPEISEPLLIAAMLVCWCTFADGPTGPGDLLLCNVTNNSSVAWKHPIKGFRAILEAVASDYARNTMVTASSFIRLIYSSDVEGATYSRVGFPRIDWHKAVYSFREFAAASTEDDKEVLLLEIDQLVKIFAAVYGDENGEYHGPQENRHILGWLYRIEGKFVQLLQTKRPTALLALAYYAVLFKCLDQLWFMDKWAKHLISTVQSLLGESYLEWVQWPMEQVGLS